MKMTRAELAKLKDEVGEYSCSIPSLTTIGKRWVRNDAAYTIAPPEPERWALGEYIEHPDPAKREKLVRIRWTLIDVVDLPPVEWSRAFG